MNLRTYTQAMIGHLRPPTLYRLISLLIMAGMTLGSLGTAQAAAQPASRAAPVATTNTLTLQVISAATRGDHTVGEAIPNYKFLINEDNTGDPTDSEADCRPALAPNPNNADLANCDWPSIRAVPGSAPIVTQGDQSDLASGLTLPPGRYLISVMADDFKLGGAHFTVPLANPGLVTVELQPDPLPLATMRIQVFEDNTSPNGQMDAPTELGLNNFEGRISDVLGEISTDWYGNPLCTEYQRNGSGTIIFDGDGLPIPITGTGGKCLSGDTNHDGAVNGSDDPADRGLITIPNIGSGRYAALVVPPDGTDWVQTTTLEGGHDWDTWLQEGATGYDTEFLFAGEPFPWTMFGFVRPKALSVSGSRQIKGTVVSISVFIPPQGGQPIPGGEWGGLSGARINGPVDRPYIALSDLNSGDQMIYMKRANANGTFTINNVPDGNYLLTVWDGPQTHLIDFYNVTVNGSNVDMGNVFLTGWFAHFKGSVFIDSNGNGKRDSGEKGLAGQWVSLRSRSNNAVQHGSVGVTTDDDGYYDIQNGYPYTAWEIMEVYNDRYYTTGITYKADNGPETTVLGQGVDVNILPIIGLNGRLDWGVKPYVRGENGGIVGTVTYDVTRNELDPRLAAAEDWQPSIPGMTVNLYHAVRNPDGSYATDPDGSYTKGALIDSVTTESWERPTGCVARDVDGVPVVQNALPTAPNADCVEAPMMGIQFGPNADGGNFGATVDGNYGFGDLVPGDYLVEVVSPLDMFGKPLYKVTREEDINVFNGDNYTTQLPPPACAGALHVVDVAGVGADGPNATDNPNFAAEGGSPFEGQMRPLCDVKLVRLQDSRSIAPTFNFHTDVPLPGRFMGYIVDDLNLSTDPRTTLFGEKAGLANAPIGIYDFADRLVTTIQSDPNGLWEILLPSTLQINCPTPSGVCANMYRFVGNDPGQPPDKLNPNHNPQYRTISANFEVWPGVINPADLAPTQIAVSIQGPGSQFNAVSACTLEAATPKLFAVSKPFVRSSDSGAARQITIYGDGFGATQGTGQVTLDTVALSINSWTDDQIVVTIPAVSAATRGARQLMVRANNGQTTVNGLTFHVLTGNGNSTGSGGTVDPTTYNPRILTVNANPAFAGITNFTSPGQSIQDALNAAANNTGNQRYLVVVFPGPTYTYNPTGIYFENLVLYSPVKLQGVGPGGVYTNSATVLGTVLDGVGFTNDNPASEDWRVLVEGIPHGGTANVAEGEVIYVLPSANEPFNANANYPAAIDGLTIQGGDQMGFPNNINFVGGGQAGGGQPQSQGFIETQGGGIYVHSDATSLRITNNILKSNGGAYAGAIRLGTPEAGVDNNNDNIRIAYNRILANGGTNLAGAVGIFRGADTYEIDHNDLCGNFSAEYGGAISHYGVSPNGSIHHNRIYFNQSYDEGGGIMIVGELPVPPLTLSTGTGPVSVYNNLIQSNLGNDDGGGVRVLMSNNDQINIYNNFIVNNISTDEGGGIALDTAANVRVMNNTIMKNLTTATAATSSGLPKPAGLTTNASSPNLVLFNNIFWDNRAGSWNGVTVGGIGLPTDAAPVRLLDLGIVGAGLLNPTNSILNALTGTISSTTNLFTNPLVIAPYDTSVAVFPWRTNPNMVQAAIVAVDLPVNLLGNYHLQSGSPAINLGAPSKNGVNAPTTDIDDQARPANGCLFDSGADEVPGGPTCQVIHIGDMDASVSNQSATTWQATVTIAVHNSSHNPVAGVVVSGTWSVGGSGIVTCTTNASGQCNVTRGGFSKASVMSVNFTVSNATGTNMLYQTAPNHDPDGDSTGGVITVNLPRMHIGDLDASVANSGATNWQATVTITVHNASDSPVAGAVVSGTWSVGGSGTVTCTTNASGQCSLTRGGFSKASVSSVNFTVSSATHAAQALAYQSSANHDADGDSNGTLITVVLPRMHVGDLDARIANDGAANWQATVTITVHNIGHSPVVGAVISGTWSVGGSGTVTCTTNASGQCTVTRGGFSKTSVGSVTFTVSNASHATQAIVYQSSANHDPDGDSNGTAITITPAYMHVGDLDWRRSTLNASTWQAVVTVTVHTPAHGAVANATVTGAWTNANGGPVLGSATCVTNASGQCTVTASLSRLVASGASATFTVTNVTLPGNTRLYRATNNHDPDAAPQNSNGTTITVIRP